MTNDEVEQVVSRAASSHEVIEKPKHCLSTGWVHVVYGQVLHCASSLLVKIGRVFHGASWRVKWRSFLNYRVVEDVLVSCPANAHPVNKKPVSCSQCTTLPGEFSSVENFLTFTIVDCPSSEILIKGSNSKATNFGYYHRRR